MSHPKFVVIISANIEWEILKTLLPPPTLNSSPLGQWFEIDLNIGATIESVLFFHGGWGKIAAAASTQYVLDRWSPRLLVNLGTCGGFEGEIEKGTIILVERTLVYDIIELMDDHDEHLAHYTTRLDLSWLKEDYPQPVRRTLLVSADRDVLAEDIPRLKAEFGAVAGDWESAAIAWVAARQQTPCLILRGVSDLIGGSGGEAYDGNIHIFVEGTTEILKNLVAVLPDWLACADINLSSEVLSPHPE